MTDGPPPLPLALVPVQHHDGSCYSFNFMRPTGDALSFEEYKELRRRMGMPIRTAKDERDARRLVRDWWGDNW